MKNVLSVLAVLSVLTLWWGFVIMTAIFIIKTLDAFI
jgi:hypothetical protein